MRDGNLRTPAPNPWPLQAWLGHERIDETMVYVHVAEAHPHDLPDVVCNAISGIAVTNRRVLAMLGARGSHTDLRVVVFPSAPACSFVFSLGVAVAWQ